MEKNPEPLPEGIDVIMHIIQTENNEQENLVEVNDECQNTKDS